MSRILVALAPPLAFLGCACLALSSVAVALGHGMVAPIAGGVLLLSGSLAALGLGTRPGRQSGAPRGGRKA